VSKGPPPVPGGRTPEEREAARREREARRAARTGRAAPARDGGDGRPSDWLAEAQTMTVADPDGPNSPSPPGEGEGTSNGGRWRRPSRSRRPRWSRLIVAALFFVVLAGATWFLLELFQPFKDDGDGQRVRVVIPKGAGVGEIADLLEERGVIESAGFFELRARFAGRTGDLKPGSYELREDMSYGAALDALEQGVPPNVVVVTIPEGRSRREVARLVRGKLRGGYLRASRRSRDINLRRYGAAGAKNLEGFLFPATYELKKSQPVSRLVDEQLAAFEKNFANVDMRYARSKNLTPYDVLIIASMVEREAQVARERRLIASVIYNRLRQGINLGIDATIRYALGQWTKPLRQSELASPSPYNTRTNPGLPPGPIGNPGLASIQAAAHPARAKYLFYVVKPGKCGEHAFSATDAQFQRDVRRYNTEREKRGGKSPTNC
jgi:UPF0755 protein